MTTTSRIPSRVTVPVCPPICGELRSRETCPTAATLDRLNDEVRRLEGIAAIDRLTGAFTRTYLDEMGHNELVRLDRYGHPCSVIFMDVDGLKAVNDTQGHAAGDRLLRRVFDIVSATARGTDRVGRYGGDEFVLLLPNTPLDSAVVIAARVRDALQEEALAGGCRTAASFGVVEARLAESWAALLQRADAAMYRAKAKRSNHVMVDERRETVSGEHVDASFIQLHWHEAYACGNPGVDGQHLGLFSRGNALLAAVANRRPDEEVGPLVSALLNEVASHFADEERLLGEARWPYLEAHARIHTDLFRRARALSDAFFGGSGNATALVDFLAFELIARHILREDRAFIGAFASPGTPAARA